MVGWVSPISRNEMVLTVTGDRGQGKKLILSEKRGVFVVETVSVILQVVSYQLTGKRLFKMAPLHHHFELKGWPEPRVIVRFWIITFILVLIGLATLKLR